MARALTPHEAAILAERELSLAAQRREAPAMLEQLATRIGVEAHLPLSQWVEAIDVALVIAREAEDPHAIVWWVARLGHFVAAALAAQYGAIWWLDREPESRTFLRPVVGVRAPGRPLHDPFRVAATVFAEGLVLADVMDRIEREVQAAGGV